MQPADKVSVETSLRQMRIIHAAMLISIVLYAFISLRLPVHVAPQPTILYGIAFAAVANVGVIFVVRNRLLSTPGPISSPQQNNQGVLARWRTACIVTWALCEAIALYGLVLHFIGFQMSQSLFFFIVGFVLMLLFAPRPPSN
jgi:hypothetical protein